MDWNRIEIETNELGSDIVTALLIECGINGLEIIEPREQGRFLKENTGVWDYADKSLLENDSEKVTVIFYQAAGKEGAEQTTQIKNELSKLKQISHNIGSLDISVKRVNSLDWQDEWKKHFQTLIINRVAIVPAWEDYLPITNQVIVKIDPGFAFGTGQHQSTQMAIESLSKYVKPGYFVLDLGCGSGILSITSLQLGADFCFACDIDEVNAVSATKKNAELNEINNKKLRLASGDAISDISLKNSISEFKYDIVVANIVADVVMQLASFVKDVLRHNGLYIATGIIDEKRELVESKFTEAGFKIIDIVSLEGWVLVIGQNDG